MGFNHRKGYEYLDGACYLWDNEDSMFCPKKKKKLNVETKSERTKGANGN